MKKTDVELRDDVLAEIEWEPSIDGAQIGVTAHDGVVSLTGQIGSYLEKTEAIDAAKRVAGVAAVADELEVSWSAAARDSDTSIAERVRQALDSNASVPKEVKAIVDEGRVTLEGEVKWPFQRQAAERVVKSLRGVRTVVNAMKVLPSPATPTVIKGKIEAALHRRAGIDASRITVRTEGSKVILEGSVPALYEREAAESAAWSAPGLAELGTADRIIIDRDTTTIVGGHGSPEAVKTRCDEIRHEIEKTTSDYDRERLQERLAKLAGGVAVIRVGAPSGAEAKSLKDAYDDAIHATQAAIAEGIVPGGGVAYVRIARAVATLADQTEGDERTALRILTKALESPARQIAENSGVDSGVVIERITNGSGGYGFDAATGSYGDLIVAGIIDPTKVMRVALQNAVSVAGVLLLAEATLTEVPDEEDQRSQAVAEM